MFIRLNRVKQNGRTYRYAHLVESYRRPEDGRPAHRVLKALGTLSDAEIESWQTLLRALDSGRRVVLAPEAAVAAPPLSPEANLRYLDVAVLLELFREWELDTLLDTVLATGDPAVAPSAIVAGLTIQRCAEPGSKLFGSRWIPQTALPELLGVAPGAFNNTRLHRVLDGLAEVGDALQTVLARRCQEREGAFLSLFLDTSEAVFEGRGPELAEKSMTKDGVIRRRVSIPLLCNHRGYPLRWDVLPGKSADCNVFVEACQALSNVSWARRVPVVLDRAAGTTEIVAQLLDTGLHFLTALVSSEKAAYASSLPCEALDGLAVGDPDAAAREAAERIERAGLVQARADLFACDLGIVQRMATPRRKRRTAAADAPAQTEPVCRRALQWARQIQLAVEQRTSRSRAAAAAAVNLSVGLSKKYSVLLRLAFSIQEAVLQGAADALTFDALARVARLPLDQQPAAFESARRRYETVPPPTPEPDKRDVRVRVVAYFNPTLFVEKRSNAERRIERARAKIDALNKKIARTPGRWSREKAAAAADRILRRDELLGVFTLAIHTSPDDHTRVEARLDNAEWAKRRRYDGFTVLVAHPEIGGDAQSLCALYRQREIVEHDFRVIKSLVELHPVRHRLDHKVRAHVTLCMLALLLERTLRQKLGPDATSEYALETLATCHLNHYGAQGYALTRPTPEQRRLVAALQLTRLLDDTQVSDRITPR